MGGRGAYSQSGGFREQTYRDTGIRIDGYKVIESKKGGSSSLPQMSNTPGTVYILRSNGHLKSIGVYGQDRRLQKEIEFQHGHTNRYKSGNRVKLKRGVAHVHSQRGGRENNVRYMTPKEVKRFGEAIRQMGGRVHE